MSESQETFDQMGKDHRTIYNAILANAWLMAGYMVTGTTTLVDGKYIPAEHGVLADIMEASRKKS
jgi:hypothetical protein